MMKNAVVKPRPTGVKSDLQFVRPQRYESPYLQPLNNRIKQQKQKLAKPKGRRKLRGISSASSNSLNQKLLAFPDTGGSGDCKAEKFTQKFLDENLHNIYKLIVENKGRLSGVNNWQQKLVQNLNKTTDTEKMADQGETPPEHPRGSRISQLKNLIPRRSNRASNPSSNAGETGGATNAAEGGAAGGNEDRTVAVRGNEDRTVGRGAEGGNEGGEGTVPEAGIGGNVAGEAARDATGGAAGEVPGEVAADATGGTPADAAGGAPVAVAAGAPADADAARDLAELPTAQSNIMNELREADAKAQRTAQIIEAMKEELAALAKKDKMTPDDAKMIERKQAELMEKLSEFEQITTQVQQLVGLTDITSKVIIEQKLAQRRLQAQDPIPEESLPKVIVCGGGGIDPVPKIIVCEPTNRQGCGQPLYQQLSGRSRRSQNQQAPCKKKMTSDCPPQQIMSGFQPPQQQSWGYGGNAAAGCTGGGGGIMGGPWSAGYNQVFPVGPMGAWPPPHISVTPSAHSTCQEDSINPMVIKISTPVTCSPTSSTINVDQETAGDAKNDDEKEGEPKVPTKEELEKKKCDALATKASDLQKEVQALNEENKELKKVLGVGKTVTLCKNEIAKEQVCKADILRQIGVPLPKSYVQGECCRAYQDAMGLQFFNSPCNIPKSELINPAKSTICKSGTCGGASTMTTSDGKVCKQKFTAQINPGSGGVGGYGPSACKGQSKDMENIVMQMEEEVRAIQKELEMVQAERRGLELQKKLLSCSASAPVKSSPCGQPITAGEAATAGMGVNLPGISPVAVNLAQVVGGPQLQPIQQRQQQQPLCPMSGNTCEQLRAIPPSPCKKQQSHCVSTTSAPALKVPGPPAPPPLPSPPCVVALEAQLSSLREQYKKLQTDYNCKVEEVSIVRCELESAKRESLSSLEKCQEAEIKVDDLLERLRAVEQEKALMSGSKDQMMEIEQQLTLAKQRYRESQEELEESRTNLQETCAALEEYRNKYLSAQQTVEEQRRQLDVMEIENSRISEHINMEIKRVKSQFQEKLEELTPLPEMLKLSHQKLHECQQLRAVAERSVETLNKEVADLKAEKAKLLKQLDDLKKGSSATDAEKANLQSSLSSGEKKLEELKTENVKLKATLARLEELALSKDRRLDEKSHEVLQLSTQLETLREESARQVSRTKDRCEAVRRTLQTQISDLERQLAQSRAAARTAQMDRDEIRAKMQTQIQCLNENFNQAQLRIRSLQTNVNYLKNSYTNIFAPDRQPVGPLPIDICGQAP